MALALLLAAQLAAAAPPQDCQAALGPLHNGTEETALPGRVDGATIQSVGALVALRRDRGDALITVNGGNFARADFRGVRLHNICFLDTDLSGTDWRGARASGVGFVRANLAGANLTGAHLERLLIRNANMDDVNATGAFLVGGRFDGGWFEGSITRFRLDRADLTGYRFDCGITLDDGCPVYQGEAQISLRGANLSRANLFGGADLAGARIDNTLAGPGSLRDLRDARLDGPILVQGGDSVVALTPVEYRALLPHILDPLAPAAELARPASPPAWARPGVEALFIDTPLMFDDAFRQTDLYRRLLPALIGASGMHVIVSVGAQGGIDAEGEAVGANAHMCSLSGEGLRFDPASGYYSGPYEPQPDDPPGWRGRQVPVLMLSGERAQVYRGGRAFRDDSEYPVGDHASCGARAGFDTMIRVPANAAEINRLRGGQEGRGGPS